MTIDHATLKKLVLEVFAAAGSHHHEAERIAHYLVEANLVGHDSHGVIQVPRYVDRVRAGTLIPNQTVEIVSENEISDRARRPARVRPGHRRGGHAHRPGQVRQVWPGARGAEELGPPGTHRRLGRDGRGKARCRSCS